MAGEVPFSDLNFSADDFTWNLSDFSSSDNWTTFTYSDQFQKYSIANSFRKALETVLTNCPECAKSDCKSWWGRIKNSFNKLAAGI